MVDLENSKAAPLVIEVSSRNSESDFKRSLVRCVGADLNQELETGISSMSSSLVRYTYQAPGQPRLNRDPVLKRKERKKAKAKTKRTNQQKGFFQ